MLLLLYLNYSFSKVGEASLNMESEVMEKLRCCRLVTWLKFTVTLLRNRLMTWSRNLFRGTCLLSPLCASAQAIIITTVAAGTTLEDLIDGLAEDGVTSGWTDCCCWPVDDNNSCGWWPAVRDGEDVVNVASFRCGVEVGPVGKDVQILWW